MHLLKSKKMKIKIKLESVNKRERKNLKDLVKTKENIKKRLRHFLKGRPNNQESTLNLIHFFPIFLV